MIVTLFKGVEIQPCISDCDTVQRHGDSTVYILVIVTLFKSDSVSATLLAECDSVIVTLLEAS